MVLMISFFVLLSVFSLVLCIPLFLGFEDYGMKNPLSSLGFLHMRLRFEWSHPPQVAALLSICLPPSSVWLIPSSPEPHYVQTFGERCKEWGSREPRWITKFFKLSSEEYMYSVCVFLCPAVFI